MADNDEVRMTERQLKMLNEQAVLKSKMGDMEGVIPEVFVSLKALNKSINEIPLRLVECKSDVEASVKDYMHDKFITDTDLRQFERDVEKKISEGIGDMRNDFSKLDTKISRVSWVISGFITAATTIIYLIEKTHLFGS